MKYMRHMLISCAAAGGMLLSCSRDQLPVDGVFRAVDSLGVAPPVGVSSLPLTCDERWDDCVSLSPADTPEPHCGFDYQLCMGAEAYDRAFSFVSPVTIDEKEKNLRKASYHLASAMFFGAFVYKYAHAYFGYHYITKVAGYCAVGAAGCSYHDYRAANPGVDEEINDYVFSNISQALERFLAVADALVELQLAAADASGSIESTYGERKQREFELRAAALSNHVGGNAILPACLIDSEKPDVARAVALLRGADRNAGFLSNLDPATVARATRPKTSAGPAPS